MLISHNNKCICIKSSFTFVDELCSEVIEITLPKILSDLESIRYKVFKDLWSKGFYLTCGMKFGGDFLVYEGQIFLLRLLIVSFNYILFYFRRSFSLSCKIYNKLQRFG